MRPSVPDSGIPRWVFVPATLAAVFIVLPLVAFGRSVRRKSRMAQDTLAEASAYAGEQIGAINPWMADYMTVGWMPYFGVADIDAASDGPRTSMTTRRA